MTRSAIPGPSVSEAAVTVSEPAGQPAA